MREIVIATTKEKEVSADELYELWKSAYAQWGDAGLKSTALDISMDVFRRTLDTRVVLVAYDASTEEVLAMRTLVLNKKKGCAAESNLSVLPKAKRQGIGTKLMEAEAERLLKAGYRYVTCYTATTATWSVRWHLKNGYRITGYVRSEGKNYASYRFRKQIAYDIRRHPTDLLWTRPMAPLTACVCFVVTYIATCVCKTREGKLNWIGRWAKRVAKSLQRC